MIGTRERATTFAVKSPAGMEHCLGKMVTSFARALLEEP
jgi:hypothetical protein